MWVWVCREPPCSVRAAGSPAHSRLRSEATLAPRCRFLPRHQQVQIHRSALHFSVVFADEAEWRLVPREDFFGEAFTTRSRTGRYERYREQSLSRPGKRSAPRARVGSLANFAIPMKCGSSLSRRRAPQQQRALFLAAPAAAGGRQPPHWPPSCQLLGAAPLCQQPVAAPWSGSARGAASPQRLGETQRQGKPDAAWSVCSER